MGAKGNGGMALSLGAPAARKEGFFQFPALTGWLATIYLKLQVQEIPRLVLANTANHHKGVRAPVTYIIHTSSQTKHFKEILKFNGKT